MASRSRQRRDRGRHRAETREARRGRQNAKRRIKRYVFGGLTGFAGLIIILSLVIPGSMGNTSTSNSASYAQGLSVEIQGNEVVAAGDEHGSYSTTPPTSGWRYDIPFMDMVWGLSPDVIPEEEQVAYLEQGGVLVQYNCPEQCEELVGALKGVVNRYPEGVVLSPYYDMDSKVALTAWGWIDTMEQFDDSRIDGFIQTHLGSGSDATD